MTAIQLKAEVMHNINVVAEDENMLNRVAKYLRKLVAEKQTDSTEMTKEAFYAKLERGEKAYERDECHEILPGEDLKTYLRRRGYDI
ncbi:MAG: hypothetical protein J5663_01300 [Bacteroidaceae bacterium]|nr:hypothetical protein [Bacteroidaceae bacterium]